MAVKRVIKGVHVVPLGMVNAFLIEGDDVARGVRLCSLVSLDLIPLVTTDPKMANNKQGLTPRSSSSRTRQL